MVAIHLPALLSSSLKIYDDAQSDEDLANRLIKEPTDLLVFFEAACDDETWTEAHHACMRQLISWITKQSFDDRLSTEYALRAAKAMRKHHLILHPFIHHNIKIKLKDGEVEVNGLLLSLLSEFFQDILLHKCRDRRTTVLEMTQTTKKAMAPFLDYVNTGQIAALVGYGQEELLALLHQASAWGVNGVIELCEMMLRKYVTDENVFELLILSHKMGWRRLKQICVDYINAMECGLRLSFSNQYRLGIEFYNFTEKSLAFFQKVSPYATDLIGKGMVVIEAAFGQVLQQCPNLQSVDLTSSKVFSPYYASIPTFVTELNLSQCQWLSADTFKQIIKGCPEIESLHLCSNAQLNFNVWGELLELKRLKFLDLAYCNQIKDDDLKIIVTASPAVTSLILKNCIRISDIGFFDLAKGLPHLTKLNLAHCRLSDRALANLGVYCRGLLSIDLSHCDDITEKGVIGLVKQSFALRECNLTNTNLAPMVFEKIKQLNPRLSVTRTT